MTDIILGMGEVGETLFDLLVERGIRCIGIDENSSKKSIQDDVLLAMYDEYCALTSQRIKWQRIDAILIIVILLQKPSQI